MLLGQQVFSLEPFMYDRGSCVIGDGGGCRFHVGDQMRVVFLTRFREMDFEPDPAGGALLTVMGLETRRAS